MLVKPVSILVEAAADIEEGWRFYERQDAELGGYFTRCILQDLRRLERLHGRLEGNDPEEHGAEGMEHKAKISESLNPQLSTFNSAMGGAAEAVVAGEEWR